MTGIGVRKPSTKCVTLGLQRIAAPYPGAADLHFPLIDSLVERLKPFYYQQLYGKDQFATFTSLTNPTRRTPRARWGRGLTIG